MRKTYTGIVTNLPENGIFVFGSNTQGRHGKGSALLARNKFGAIYGQSKGLQGRSYAIVTKDLTVYQHPSISPDQIKEQIKDLYELAIKCPDNEFLVAYSGEGSNLNSYSPLQMAEMFSSFDIPVNMVFEEKFNQLIIKFNE